MEGNIVYLGGLQILLLVSNTRKLWIGNPVSSQF